jgi:hypothetical protein
LGAASDTLGTFGDVGSAVTAERKYEGWMCSDKRRNSCKRRDDDGNNKWSTEARG